KADLRQQLRGRIEAVEHAVRDRRAADAAANVNWVARIAEEMAARYEPGVPPDVRLLAFYGRAAEADAAAHRTDRVKADLADAETVWRRVEPMVLQRRAPDAARQFSDALVRLEGDHANDIREAADAEVTAANRIAELFARPARP